MLEIHFCVCGNQQVFSYYTGTYNFTLDDVTIDEDLLTNLLKVGFTTTYDNNRLCLAYDIAQNKLQERGTLSMT